MRIKTWAAGVHGFGGETGKTSVWKIPGCWITPGFEGALFKHNHWGSQPELAGAWRPSAEMSGRGRSVCSGDRQGRWAQFGLHCTGLYWVPPSEWIQNRLMIKIKLDNAHRSFTSYRDQITLIRIAISVWRKPRSSHLTSQGLKFRIHFHGDNNYPLFQTHMDACM